jgi:hypothetical protein
MDEGAGRRMSCRFEIPRFAPCSVMHNHAADQHDEEGAHVAAGPHVKGTPRMLGKHTERMQLAGIGMRVPNRKMA